MKKKGLIISTVVMVVVLLASLTTATYAWFSATADARIAPIGMTAQAAEGILIGVRQDTMGTGLSRDDFANGDVSWTGKSGSVTDGKWSGTNGFGNLLTPQVNGNALQLNVTQAMKKKALASTDELGTVTPAGSADNALFIKAPAGAGGDTTAGAFSVATANVDYIQLDLGLIASTHNTIDQIIGTIKVTPTDPDVIGMAAAVHFEIAIKAPGADTTWTTLAEIDAYGGRQAGVSTFEETTGYDGQLDANKVWTYDFEVWKAEVGKALSTMAEKAGEADKRGLEVVQVKLIAWIEGTDNSCKTAYTGTGATIDISFRYSKTDTTDFTISTGVATGGGTAITPVEP